MMQADRERNFNWPVNCPAVTRHEKGPIECVLYYYYQYIPLHAKNTHKESSLPTFQDKCFSNQLLKNEGKTATNASGTAGRGRGFDTPNTCQIAIKIIISGKLMYFIIGSC